LTGLRFFAAALVVVHHTVSNNVFSNGLLDLPVLAPLATLGFTGVTFFFVLSGFVLSWSHRTGAPRGRFYGRRVARVYPLHVFTWVIALTIALLTTAESWGPALLNLVLLQSWSFDPDVVFSVNSVSWSLSCEAFFYAFFPFVIEPVMRLAPRRQALLAVAVLGGLALGPVIGFLLDGKDGVGVCYTFPAYRALEFVLGIVLASAISAGWRPRLSWPATLAVTVGSFGAVMVLNHLVDQHTGSRALPRPAATLALLPAYVALILRSVLDDLGSGPRRLATPALVRLGMWSFALYLTHLLLIEDLIGRTPLQDALQSLPTVVALAIVLVACTAVSGAAFRLVEHPCEARIRRAIG
jgi:peptidoglycan/LPS O-acetylase OafA/YrhL